MQGTNEKNQFQLIIPQRPSAATFGESLASSLIVKAVESAQHCQASRASRKPPRKKTNFPVPSGNPESMTKLPDTAAEVQKRVPIGSRAATRGNFPSARRGAPRDFRPRCCSSERERTRPLRLRSVTHCNAPPPSPPHRGLVDRANPVISKLDQH